MLVDVNFVRVDVNYEKVTVIDFSAIDFFSF